MNRTTEQPWPATLSHPWAATKKMYPLLHPWRGESKLDGALKMNVVLIVILEQKSVENGYAEHVYYGNNFMVFWKIKIVQALHFSVQVSI